MRKCRFLILALAALMLLAAGCGEENLLTHNAYTFDLNTGVLKLTENGQTRRLGVLAPLIWRDDERGGSWNELADFSVELTPAGNYLFVGEGTGSGTFSFHYQMTALVPAAGGPAEAYMAADTVEPIPAPFWQGDNLWLADESGPVCVNDTTGEAVQYNLYVKDERLHGNCWWADERLMLLGDSSGFNFYDRQTGRVLALHDLLLTEELKAQVNNLLRENDPQAYPDESRFDYVWQNYGNTLLFGTSDPVPYLSYQGEQEGQFAFALCCHYYNRAKNCSDTAVFPIEISLAEVQELLF